MSRLAFIGHILTKNVIPTNSVGQTLRECSQKLHVYVKIGQRHDDPLYSRSTLHPVSFLKSIENPTKKRLTYLQSRRKHAQKCEITNCVSRDWPPCIYLYIHKGYTVVKLRVPISPQCCAGGLMMACYCGGGGGGGPGP